MAQLVLNVEKDVIGTDFKNGGKQFKFDRVYTEVNGIKVAVTVKGTARDVLEQAFQNNKKLFLGVKRESIEKDDGTLIEYDQIYFDYAGEQVPVKAQDSFGKRLIIKALQSE